MTQQAVTSPRLILDGPTRQLLDAVEADPLAPMTLGIPAPGGYGKSTVLAELARVYRACGVRVLGLTDALAAATPTGTAGSTPSAVLVDDAHQLTEGQLAELAGLAGSGQAALAVGYRPWPRSTELAGLVDVLGRGGTQLSLGPWDREHVADYLAERLPAPPASELLDFAHTQTGGVPRFVGHLGDALADGAGWGDQPEPQLPRSVITALRPDLDRLDQDVERFLLAVEAGVGRHVDLLTGLLGRDVDGLSEIMDAARATGLLGSDGALLPVARRAVAALVPAERRIGVRQRLAELQHERGGPVLDLARSLLGTGVGGSGVAAVFQAAAGEALAAQPALAAKLFTAAVAAGTPLPTLAAGWARAAARSGDLDRALRLADETIATDDAPDRAAAAEVAAAALAHRGQLGRSAELYRWAGPGFPASFAAIGLIGTGQIGAGQLGGGQSVGGQSGAGQSGTGGIGAGQVGADQSNASQSSASQFDEGQRGAGPANVGQVGAGQFGAGQLGAGHAGVGHVGVGGFSGAAGFGAEADGLFGGPSTGGPPTLLAGAATLMAQGVRESVGGVATAALSQLVRASALLEPAGQGLLLPDSPAALAALVGLHGGELALAESVLDRAAAANLGGPLLAARHRLLQAWIAMARGRMTTARDNLVAATRTARVLEPRDWLFAVALEAGLARRNSDLATLRRTWSQACEAVMRHPVDLFTLLPLGEFAVAAARLRDQARLRPHLDEAMALLASLGNPPLWSTPLHWSCLHAAIIAEQPAEAREHAAALAANAEHCAYCAVLATAADCWLEVVTGDVDASRVEAAARALHGAGLCWDGARLAGQAAIRTSDRKAMVSLLNCARVLQGRPARTVSVPPSQQQPSVAPVPAGAQAKVGQAHTTPGELGAGVLSEREREVAILVLAGLTYKQVGDRLFISAKTVEHHVARMRQKLGATSRAELFDQLRQLVRGGPQV